MGKFASFHSKSRTFSELIPGLFLISVSIGFGQTGSGTIQGRVSDSQQLTIPQPRIELQDSQKHTVQTVTGDGEGHYEIHNVGAGSWTVRFTRVKASVRSKRGPSLSAADQKVVLDAVLKPERNWRNPSTSRLLRKIASHGLKERYTPTGVACHRG